MLTCNRRSCCVATDTLPGHRPPAFTFSSTQGSLPCSRKEITSGLDMARPGDEKIHHRLYCRGPQDSFQSLIPKQARQLQERLEERNTASASGLPFGHSHMTNWSPHFEAPGTEQEGTDMPRKNSKLMDRSPYPVTPGCCMSPASHPGTGPSVQAPATPTPLGRRLQPHP